MIDLSRRSAWVPLTLVGIVLLGVVLLPSIKGQNPPSKEYIRLGTRVIAIENPPLVTLTINSPSRTTIGYGETAQFTATVTGTSSPVSWAPAANFNPQSGPSVFYTAPPPGPLVSQVVTITASVPTVSQTAQLTVNPIFLPTSAAGIPASGGSG